MLDIAPQIEKAIITQAQNKGVTINELLADIFAPKPAPTLYDMAMAYDGADVSEIELEPQTIADMVKGKRLESFKADPVAIQREMRDEWDRTGE